MSCNWRKYFIIINSSNFRISLCNEFSFITCWFTVFIIFHFKNPLIFNGALIFRGSTSSHVSFFFNDLISSLVALIHSLDFLLLRGSLYKFGGLTSDVATDAYSMNSHQSPTYVLYRSGALRTR